MGKGEIACYEQFLLLPVIAIGLYCRLVKTRPCFSERVKCIFCTDNEDIRPDQTEDFDLNNDVDDNFDGIDEDILDEEFPSLSVETTSKSGGSISTDQVSDHQLFLDIILLYLRISNL